MNIIFTNISELYTPSRHMSNACVAVDDGKIAWVGPATELPEAYRAWDSVDLSGCGVLPGLVDSHTHLVWAGSRLDEYGLRAKGASYEEILEAEGGIYNTVRATQNAGEDELFELARSRAEIFLSGGVTSLEVKSGYGLEPEHELKMLRVVRRLAEAGAQHFVPTLLAHVIPKDRPRADYLEMFTRELIPEVARTGLAEAVDVFCDRGAYTITETRQIFEAAREHGLGVKAHAEQLARTGATRLVAEMQGLSADHLEQCTPEDWQALAGSSTVGTLLPGATVLLRKPFPDARAMWDTGVKLAVATDHNPGSSPLFSMFLAMQLTIALGGLSVEEALTAGTMHTADALDRSDLGRLEVGAAADFIVIDGPEALLPLYAWGHSPIRAVYIGGERVS